MGVVLALAAAWGVFLLWTSLALGWRGLGMAPRRVSTSSRRRAPLRELLVQAGIPDLRLAEFGAVSGALALLGALIGWSLFGAVGPAAVFAVVGAWIPVAAARQSRIRRRALAREAWPRMIEELRLLAVSLGRSIPQALFEVGRRGPEELQGAFAAARREWMISTDFDRTLVVLKEQLADPTADAVCETLLIAHEIGGQEVDARLRALVEDRIMDLEGRKDAEARQAGARFARIFVLVVPLGMALVGLSIGDGRVAYQSAAGQLGVLIALAMIAGCWLWAARIMRLPTERRVFGAADVVATRSAWRGLGGVAVDRGANPGTVEVGP